jgi:hypothetical protein
MGQVQILIGGQYTTGCGLTWISLLPWTQAIMQVRILSPRLTLTAWSRIQTSDN